MTDIETQVAALMDEWRYRYLSLDENLDEVFQSILTSLVQEKAELQAGRDKWLAAFNRSAQFQNGPTKRADAAEARLAAVEQEREALREALESLRGIGRKDSSNNKYDGIYEQADAALTPSRRNE